MISNKKQKNIPKEWQEKKLGNVLKIGSGKDYKHLRRGDVPVFGTGGYMLSVDDFLYSGETVFIGRKGTIDKPFYFKGKFWTVDTLFYTYDYKNTSAKYINFVFQKINWKSYNEASGVPSLSKATIEKIKFNFPSLPEQKQIVKILETWDKHLEKLSRKIEIKKNIKKGLMQRLLTGAVRLSGFSGEWKSVKLGDVANITTGNSNRQDSGLNGKYTFFDRSEDIRTSDIYLFDGEAVIMAGEGQKFIPKYFIGKFDLHQRTYAIMDFNDTDGKFIYYYLYLNQNYLLSQAVGSTVKSLRLPMFIKMPIRLPNIKEQTAIAKILTTADQEIEVLEKKKKIVGEQKKYLLNNLVTGKIRTVKNIKKEKDN